MQQDMTDLKTLPRDHALRNKPLRDIEARYKFETGKRWIEIKTQKIAGKTFNDLGEAWMINTIWQAKQSAK